jgi:hypothetical protein
MRGLAPSLPAANPAPRAVLPAPGGAARQARRIAAWAIALLTALAVAVAPRPTAGATEDLGGAVWRVAPGDEAAPEGAPAAPGLPSCSESGSFGAGGPLANEAGEDGPESVFATPPTLAVAPWFPGRGKNPGNAPCRSGRAGYGAQPSRGPPAANGTDAA